MLSCDLLKYFPDLKEIREAPILLDSRTVGYHSTIVTNEFMGSGVHTTKNGARRVAAAEIIERKAFGEVIRGSPEDRQALHLDQVPTTCGFAAGFDEEATKFRSICEAVERWAWSKWIDDGFHIPEADPAPRLNKISTAFSDFFDRTYFFKKNIDLDFVEPRGVSFYVVLGVKNQGVFAGSKVAMDNQRSWQHALTEAWRNLRIFQMRTEGSKYRQVEWLERRIEYFALEKNAAFSQIAAARKKDWPSPNIQVSRSLPTLTPGTFVWRHLCEDYVPWHHGEVSRFVY